MKNLFKDWKVKSINSKGPTLVNEFDILAENVHPDISDLISAVPDMLEALEALKEQFETEEAGGHNRSAVLMVIDKAINKAKGKS